MTELTFDELRAAYPPEDEAAHAKAYAAATLAGELAELIYTLRTRAGLTQTQLARRMGTTQSSVARIEGGGSLPTVDLLARLSRATGAELRIIARHRRCCPGPGRLTTRCLGCGPAWHQSWHELPWIMWPQAATEGSSVSIVAGRGHRVESTVVVDESVDHGRDGDGVAEDLGPGAERLV